MDSAAGNFTQDVLIMAEAFRGANDEDTRLVLNAMAGKKTPSSLNDLKFYLVPTAWMSKAWPMLNARPTASRASSGSSENNSNDDSVDDGNSWRERVGIIQNASLLQWEHAVSSSSDEEGADNLDKKPKAVPQKTPPVDSSCPLRRELKHGEDFFLLGPNTWMLVSEKFGSDGVELRRPVVHHAAAQSTLAVALDDIPTRSSSSSNNNKSINRLVPIPPGGHFPYASMIAEQESDPEESFLPQGNQQAPQAAGLKSDVVSDEEGEPNDLFPGRNDESEGMILSENSESRLGAAPAAEPEPVLLLPPSTGSLGNSNGDGLYPSVQDMDEDATNKENDSDDIASGGIIPAAAAAGMNTRRRHGAGLGNLGNTCFMNSSIQCLAHTDPLRKYFLSGDYEKDLNKDNPLGTGGDLAVQFARLLAEMWGTSPTSGSNGNSAFQSSYSSSSAVYPRIFKSTLGRHAEQFMGYDQHDSQELATYLLDALHEDTNRVSKKPYIEKPEQGEDEPDEVAANKAWDLHLKREDSKVLENFMGLVKSRVSCSAEGCGRVSTTFDPIMYMSVPIPGSTERTLRVTFVPLDDQTRKRSMCVTLSKTAKMSKLQEKAVEQLSKAGFSAQGKPFASEDLCLADIWSHEVYNWHNLDDDIDKIRDSDVTYIYELKPKSEIQKLEEQNVEKASTDEAVMIEALEKSERDKRYKLEFDSLLKLRADLWKDKLEKYVAVPSNMQLMKILNARRGTNAERYDLYQKLDSFLDTCIREVDRAGTKRAREEGDDDVGSSSPMDQSYEPIPVSQKEEGIPELIELCRNSAHFVDVKTRYDLAVLESCAESLRRMILETSRGDKNKNKGGIEIQVICRKSSTGNSHYSTMNDKGFVNPIVMRVPSNMTVYGLRQELAKRLSRCLRLSQPLEQHSQKMNNNSPTSTSEGDVVPMEGFSDQVSEEVQSGVESMNVSTENHATNGGDPALLILRQIPLSYKKKTSTSFKTSNSKQLGSLEIESAYDSSRPISLASPSDEEEQRIVSDMTGPKGNIFLEWPAELCERVFDEVEYEASDELKDADEEVAEAALSLKDKKTVTILDCVEKYCEMEQLEETEMWYCNRCKNHVRAWKQCFLYRSPPILIMHLKRFQYSSSSHRRDKINTFIDFPLTGFDLSEHIMQWNEGEKPIYDCYAVSNHYGGLGGGHYTAYCLNDDGVWCYYDDSRITTDIDPKEVVTDAAYVVYYRRRDVEVSGLDFLEGLQETANIVQDHLDSRDSVTPNEELLGSASNPPVAQNMDVDVDVNTTDAESHASSKTMESNEGVDNHFDNAEPYDAEGAGNNNTVVFGGPLRENSSSGNGFPLQ